MKLFVYPYKVTSKGAIKLAAELGAKLIGRDVGNFDVPRANSVVVNWGAGYLSSGSWPRAWLNKPEAIHNSAEKIRALIAFQREGVRTPEFTTNDNVARRWLHNGQTIVCRTTTTGMGGRGIVIARSGDTLARAPLYTIHLGHDIEYRVHVFKGREIAVCEKIAKNVRADKMIRNHVRGWAFRTVFNYPRDVALQAINATHALGLDFSAVDVGYKISNQRAYVFETNTSPGLEIPYVIRGYVNAIQTHAGELGA